MSVDTSHVDLSNLTGSISVEVRTVPVMFEGARKPLTLTGPGEVAEFAIDARIEDGTKVRARIIISYIGVQTDGAPVLRVDPKLDIERPFKKPGEDPFVDDGYDGPVVNRGR